MNRKFALFFGTLSIAIALVAAFFAQSAGAQDPAPRTTAESAAVAAQPGSVTPAPVQHRAGGEANIQIPDLSQVRFFGDIPGRTLLMGGLVICALGLLFGLLIYGQLKRMAVHASMLEISELIYETCKTYLVTQGKFILILEAFIGFVIFLYFWVLLDFEMTKVLIILVMSLVGIAGSYGVAWFGIRVNTFANSRTAFASLRGKPYPCYAIPLKAGMSIGMLLISVELLIMLFILLFIPGDYAGACFIGFAIGESLGASVLRIAGGIFTKIADIGSDLMKIVFNVKEDDPRNPGVIADCTGDNAGDSVGPTADGFETYGVTGVALIAFITLAVPQTMVDIQVKLIVWLFAMRFLMDFMSGVAYFINQGISEAKYRGLKEFNFEAPLTRLIWIASILCISTSYAMSWLLIRDISVNQQALPDLWWQLATIIGCGTLAAVLIPEFTKVFTSSHSKHVAEIVTASREGGASLTILSGIVAGNFSAFWKGMLIAGLMAIAYFVSQQGLDTVMRAQLDPNGPLVGVGSIFAFGLVAYGFLCMGPVNIAVDSYGPVTDNAQSIFELAQTESIPGVREEIQRDFGFVPDFERGKHYLEANDAAGNTFKATAKPVLIGTAVVGATTMIFSIILLLGKAGLLKLGLTDAPVLLGLICGGSVIFWFSGASMQAVVTGAYRAVDFIM